MPERYRARLATLGRRVRVERAADTLEGDAVDVTDDGALVVRRDDGTDELVTVGDVVHLRTHLTPPSELAPSPEVPC